MPKEFYVAAYAATPLESPWQAELETAYFKALSENNKIMGIEHPYLIEGDKYSLDWLNENISPHWSIIITALPGLMQSIKKDKNFGLASVDFAGREKAISMVEDVCRYAKKVKSVKAIHLHSSPGNKQSFVKSLKTIRKMDWGNIQLNIEHCDAAIAGQQADKGFLSLEDELEAIQATGGFGMVLNWGRSVIEARTVAGIEKHIALAAKANLLKGFFFSGCTDQENNPYGQWRDTHMPPGLEGCLLTKAEIEKTLKQLEQVNPEVYYGVKVSDKVSGGELADRVNLINQIIKLM